jgi:hypothetical protein
VGQERIMDAQLESVTYASSGSLTLAIDDLMLERRGAWSGRRAGVSDLDGWLNALRRQASPLIQSPSRRADLKAWLAAVDQHLGPLGAAGAP